MIRSEVKKKQKESFIVRSLAPLLLETFRDNVLLTHFSVSRVELSKDGGLCTVFLQSLGSPEQIKTGLSEVKYLGTSTRKALAAIMQTKYVPELKFAYDEKNEKINTLNDVLAKVNRELRQNEDSEESE